MGAAQVERANEAAAVACVVDARNTARRGPGLGRARTGALLGRHRRQTAPAADAGDRRGRSAGPCPSGSPASRCARTGRTDRRLRVRHRLLRSRQRQRSTGSRGRRRTIPTNRFNEGKCDRKGRFWAGTMDDRLKEHTGALYRVDLDLTRAQGSRRDRHFELDRLESRQRHLLLRRYARWLDLSLRLRS